MNSEYEGKLKFTLPFSTFLIPIKRLNFAVTLPSWSPPKVAPCQIVPLPLTSTGLAVATGASSLGLTYENGKQFNGEIDG